MDHIIKEIQSHPIARVMIGDPLVKALIALYQCLDVLFETPDTVAPILLVVPIEMDEWMSWTIDMFRTLVNADWKTAAAREAMDVQDPLPLDAAAIQALRQWAPTVGDPAALRDALAYCEAHPLPAAASGQ